MAGHVQRKHLVRKKASTAPLTAPGTVADHQANLSSNQLPGVSAWYTHACFMPLHLHGLTALQFHADLVASGVCKYFTRHPAFAKQYPNNCTMTDRVCRTEVEMYAAAASSISHGRGQTPGLDDRAETQSATGADAKAPALPQWDCNDGDIWHKRQKACCPFLFLVRTVPAIIRTIDDTG